MPKTKEIKACKRPCGECPFRKQSLPGWLGGVSMDDTLDVTLSEHDFHCHMTRGSENVKHCAGRLLFATKAAKRFRDSDMEAIRKEVAANNSTENILNMVEFKEHHKSATVTTIHEDTDPISNYAPAGIRSAEEVRKAIAELTSQKAESPEYTVFGDNNWEAIDEAIRVIEEDIDEDDIWDDHPEDEDRVRDRMIDARQWLDGDIELDELIGN